MSTGGKQAVAETGITVTDPTSLLDFIVQESVLNSTKKLKDHSYYISPIFAILEVVKDGKNYFELQFEAYNTKMWDEAIAKIREQHGVDTLKLSKLPLTGLEFSFPRFPSGVCVLGDIVTDKSSIKTLDDTNTINLRVEDSVYEDFVRHIKERRLIMNVTFTYKCKNVQMSTMKFGQKDITNSKKFKELASGGVEYVTANDLTNIVKSVATSKSVVAYEDPGMPEKLSNWTRKCFDELLKEQKRITVSSTKEAKALQEAVMKDLGLSPKKFQPIVTHVKVAELLKEENSVSRANQVMDEHYNNQEVRERVAVETSAGWGPFSAKFGYNRESFNAQANHHRFENKQQLNEFKAKCISKNGEEVKITPRGLKVIESKTLKDSFKCDIFTHSFYPTDTTNKILSTGKFIQKNSKSESRPKRTRDDEKERPKKKTNKKEPSKKKVKN